jgi:hypothetical protein
MHILLPICGKFTCAQIAHQIFLRAIDLKISKSRRIKVVCNDVDVDHRFYIED